MAGGDGGINSRDAVLTAAAAAFQQQRRQVEVPGLTIRSR
jgi:hypothetical protein